MTVNRGSTVMGYVRDIPDSAYFTIGYHDTNPTVLLSSYFTDQEDVENEIINIIVNLCKHKNAKDCDDISMYVISKLIVSIAKPLAHIFNLLFSCGIFPDHMKIAKIIPILKNGQKTEFIIYRPISILSQFSKILEKLFNLRLELF